MGLSLVIGLIFQGCSDVSLDPETIVLKSTIVPSKLNLSADFCPQVRKEEAGKSKFIFVLDLSRSNFGEFDCFWDNNKTKPCSGPNAVPKPKQNSRKFNYFNTGLQTDALGTRFDIVKDFLAGCGSNLSADDSSFSIIGFSETAGTIKETSGQAPILSCEGLEFKNLDQALEDLEKIKDVHLSEGEMLDNYVERFYATGDPLPVISRNTNYTGALDCVNQVLMEDLIAIDKAGFNSYKIFFVSDGKPADKQGEGCEVAGLSETQKNLCYEENILERMSSAIQASIAKNVDYRLFSIFYGQEGVPVVMDKMATEGGSSESFSVNSFGQSGAGENLFCNIIGYQLGFEYRPESIAVYNLSSTVRNLEFFADSDLDGVSDQEEISQGWDPLSSRSLVPGVLDGICHKLGGYYECKARRGKVNCLAGKLNLWGLTDCDVKMLDLKSAEESDWGIDSDLDGVPDFIEILKNTNPKLPDALEDTDRDLYSNVQEIMLGMDPNKSHNLTDYKSLNEFEIIKIDDSSDKECVQGKWAIKLRDIQNNLTKRINTDLPTSWFTPNNESGQQTVLITYRMTSQSQNKPEFLYYGSQFKLFRNSSGKLEIQKGASDKLESKDFKFIGKVLPK